MLRVILLALGQRYKKTGTNLTKVNSHREFIGECLEHIFLRHAFSPQHEKHEVEPKRANPDLGHNTLQDSFQERLKIYAKLNEMVNSRNYLITM